MTPDGRILSTRPGVLDDGTGGRIVGWAEGDLAMAELKEWDPTRPAQPRLPAPVAAVPAAPPVAALPAARIVVPPTVPTARGPVVAPGPAYLQVISVSSVMAQVEPYESVAVMAGDVAPEPVVDEDDWEWTIALARARAEEVDPAVASRPKAASSKPSRPPSSPPVRPAAQLAAVSPTPTKATAIMSTVAPPSAMSSGEWPKTELIGGQIDYDHAPTAISAAIPVPVAKSPTARTAAAPPAPRPRPPTAPPPAAIVPPMSAAPCGKPATTPPGPALFSTSAPLPRVTAAATPTTAIAAQVASPAPATVIPVPSLPTLAGSAHTQARKLAPVVRSPTAQLPTVTARRLGKGTAPVEPDAPAEVEMSDDTQTQINLSIGDRTTPGIVMPMAARAVQLPSTKRRSIERG